MPTLSPKLPIALLVSSLPLFVFAQAPASAGAGTNSSKPAPEAVVLSPFEVSTSRDFGYLATNSLAGSRLNSSLKDTPAIIDVFTKEFLDDIGATTLEQAMVYANNSQVDDGDAIREIVIAIFQAHGYRAEGCADGLDALTWFNVHGQEVALVVTDVDMPRFGGIALTKAIQQIRPNLPILGMSGLSGQNNGQVGSPAMDAVADGFLRKPFGPQELLGAVARLLHPAGKLELESEAGCGTTCWMSSSLSSGHAAYPAAAFNHRARLSHAGWK